MFGSLESVALSLAGIMTAAAARPSDFKNARRDMFGNLMVSPIVKVYGSTLIIATQSPDEGARSVILSFAVSTKLVRLPVLGSIQVTVQLCPANLTFKTVSLTSAKYTR
jgi:hypothetical protein